MFFLFCKIAFLVGNLFGNFPKRLCIDEGITIKDYVMILYDNWEIYLRVQSYQHCILLGNFIKHM